MSKSKVCTKCSLEKPLADFYKCKNNKDGLWGSCKECVRSKSKEYAKENKEKISKYQGEYYRKNKQKIMKYYGEYYLANQEGLKEHSREYYNNNKEAQAYNNAQWKKKNKSKVNANNAKRRAVKLRATPPWADLSKIQEVYDEAHRLTELLGIDMHVDHIIPLQGELVSGLHVHSNLQILTYVDNLSKSNRFKFA